MEEEIKTEREIKIIKLKNTINNLKLRACNLRNRQKLLGQKRDNLYIELGKYKNRKSTEFLKIVEEIKLDNNTKSEDKRSVASAKIVEIRQDLAKEHASTKVEILGITNQIAKLTNSIEQNEKEIEYLIHNRQRSAINENGERENF